MSCRIPAGSNLVSNSVADLVPAIVPWWPRTWEGAADASHGPLECPTGAQHFLWLPVQESWGCWQGQRGHGKAGATVGSERGARLGRASKATGPGQSLLIS